MRNNKQAFTVSLIKRTGFVLIGFFLILSAAGAATSGTLNLQGSVPGILDITVTPEAGSGSLDLSIDAAGVKVASVTERSNKKAGYTVTLESANAAAAGGSVPFFENIDPEIADVLNYQISYGDTLLTLTGGSATISDVVEKTSGAGNTKDVFIDYNGATDFPYEGTYTDTLTFTITAK